MPSFDEILRLMRPAIEAGTMVAPEVRAATRGARGLPEINADIMALRGDVKGVDEAVSVGNMTAEEANRQRLVLAQRMQSLKEEAASHGSTGAITVNPASHLEPGMGAPPVQIPGGDPFMSMGNRAMSLPAEAKAFLQDRYAPQVIRDPATGRIVMVRDPATGRFSGASKELTQGQLGELGAMGALGTAGAAAGAGYMTRPEDIDYHRYDKDTPLGIPTQRRAAPPPFPAETFPSSLESQPSPMPAKSLPSFMEHRSSPPPAPVPVERPRPTRSAPPPITVTPNRSEDKDKSIFDQLIGRAAPRIDTYGGDPNDPENRAAFFFQERDRGFASGGNVGQGQQQQPNKDAAMHKALEIIHHLIASSR